MGVFVSSSTLCVGFFILFFFYRSYMNEWVHQHSSALSILHAFYLKCSSPNASSNLVIMRSDTSTQFWTCRKYDYYLDLKDR